MFLAASVFGVFASLDLFQLFFFFELAVFPKYLMIVMWGSPKTREYGGMKLTLYLFLGSVVALVGVLAVYFQSGLHTFNLLGTGTSRIWVGVPTIVVPLHLYRIWHPGRSLPVPQLGAGWARGGTDGGFDAAGRSGNEGRRFCCPARRLDAAAGWHALLGASGHHPGNDQRGLRRLHRHDPNGFQVCHRLFISLPHGTGIHRICHA